MVLTASTIVHRLPRHCGLGRSLLYTNISTRVPISSTQLHSHTLCVFGSTKLSLLAQLPCVISRSSLKLTQKEGLCQCFYVCTILQTNCPFWHLFYNACLQTGTLKPLTKRHLCLESARNLFSFTFHVIVTFTLYFFIHPPTHILNTTQF